MAKKLKMLLLAGSGTANGREVKDSIVNDYSQLFEIIKKERLYCSCELNDPYNALYELVTTRYDLIVLGSYFKYGAQGDGILEAIRFGGLEKYIHSDVHLLKADFSPKADLNRDTHIIGWDDYPPCFASYASWYKSKAYYLLDNHGGLGVFSDIQEFLEKIKEKQENDQK